MKEVLIFIAALLAAYLTGAFPTSYLMARIFKGIDIRAVGSGNAGATNVLRSVGKIPAILTLFFDILKGVLAVTLVSQFFYSLGLEKDLYYDIYRGILGLAAICGHIWPVFLGFKGGKGVATTLGVGAVIAPGVLLPSIVIWTAVFFLSSYVSLASIAALIAFPIIAVIFNQPLYIVILGAIIAFIGVYKHKSNINRLINREENKTIIFKKR